MNEKTNKSEIAVFGAGCFWGVEDILRKIPGVIDTEVGYSGGSLANPTYKEVCTGETGHAECVRIEFDPNVISFKELLHYFFRLHDPTTLNQQGNDRGTQYRSVVFYFDNEQKRVAEEVKLAVDRSGKWKRPVVTQIEKAQAFYPAESYHQDYLEKFPQGYTCHYLRD